MNEPVQAPPPNNVTPARPTRSSWLWLRLTLLSSLLVVCSALALLGSNVGLQLLWAMQPRLLPALQIAELKGNLWQGIEIRRLQYLQPNLDLQLAELQLQLDAECLWRRQLCLTLFQLNGLTVTRQEPPQHNPDGGQSAAAEHTLSVPFHIKINQVLLNDTLLQLPGQRVRIASLHTQLELTDQELRLDGTIVRQSTIELQPLPQSTTATNPLPALMQLQLPFAVQVASLHLADVRVLQQQQAVLALQSLDTSLSLTAQQWRLQQTRLQLETPQLELAGEVTLQPSAQHLALQLQLHAKSQQLPGPLQLSLQGEGPMRQWQLQANSVSPWPLQLTLQTDLLSQALRFSAELHSDELHWPSSQQQAAATESLLQQLSLQKLQATINGDLAQQQLKLKLGTAHQSLPPAEWQLSASQHQGLVMVEQLQVKTLNGHADLTGQFDFSQHQLKASLQLQGLEPGLYWADYPGDVSGLLQLSGDFKRSDSHQWQLHAHRVQLNGELRNQPLKLNGEILVKQPNHGVLQVHTPGLSLQHGPNQLALQGKVAEQVSLDANLNITDLAYSLAQAEGAVEASMQLRGDAKQPDLQFNVRASNLSYLDDYALATLNARLVLPALGDKASQISLNAKNGQAPGWQLQQIDWESEGTKQQHQTHLTFDSNQLKGVLAMQAGLNAQQWQSQVTELRLQSDMGDWILQDNWQVKLNLAQQQAELAAACWQQAEATICLQPTKQLSKKQGEVAFRLLQAPLDSLDAVLPPNLSLEGHASGEMQLNWHSGRLSLLKWQLQSPQGLVRHQLTTPLDLPWRDLTLSGVLQDFQLKSKLNAILDKNSPLAARVDIGQLNTQAPTIKADVQLAPMSLSFLQPVFSELTRFDGLLSANLRAEGALTNPAVYGSVAIDALQLVGQQAPLELTKASLLANFRGFAASLNSDWHTPDGRLSVIGDANWLTPDAWFSQIDVKGDKLSLQLTDAELTVSPQLRLTASPHSAQVTGNIDIPDGNIRFNSLPENATQVSDDEVVITKQQRAGKKSNWVFSSDIRLKIGEQVRLAAFGLKTRLQGDLRVRQQGLVPTLHGQVLLKDGSFRAYGQDLRLRKGRLTFNGPANQPLLAIEAIRNPEKTEDNVIAGLRVNGLADNPLVEAFTEPAKPQANALAYLLLGRDLGSSAGDGAVTTGLIGISIANSGQLVGAIGEAFGISDLSLDTAGSGDKSKVTVSGYLSPRLQVKYGVGIFSQFGEFTLRYRLMQQVYVEAVQGLATSVDVLYKMEFD